MVPSLRTTSRYRHPFLADDEALAGALARLPEEDALALPLLSPEDRAKLTAAAGHLSFRAARSSVGQGAQEVRQDFELTEAIPETSPFRLLTRELEEALQRAARRLPRNPLEAAFQLNDLMIQRYAPAAGVITPHRDHLRYRNLVAIVILAGQGRFYICENRAGEGLREIASRPGDLLLMRAPGFAGLEDRPFHGLDRVVRERLILGLRWDTRQAQDR